MTTFSIYNINKNVHSSDLPIHKVYFTKIFYIIYIILSTIFQKLIWYLMANYDNNKMTTLLEQNNHYYGRTKYRFLKI